MNVIRPNANEDNPQKKPILAFSMTTKQYIQVIVPLKLEWEPYYYVCNQEVKIGERVRVSFAGKNLIAVVSKTDVEPGTDIQKIKAITGIAEGLSPVSESEIDLWKSISDYYLCTIGEVYKAAYPSQKVSGEEALAKMEKKRQEKKEQTIINLRKKADLLGTRLLKRKDALERATKEEAKVKYEAGMETIKNQLETIGAQLSSLLGRPHEAQEEMPGLAMTGQKCNFDTITLTSAQETAFAKIKESFASNKPALLNGVTGSGKTEIYLKLAQDTLQKGKNVLYLVPEISLSRQLEERLRKIFPDTLMVFHSRETPAQRQETAQAVKNGPYIVLGTRSALFLPHRDLGLVIVDEEHDTSYKQTEPAPRYNGRDTAVMLSVITRCSIVLGSATPSAESLFNCAAGKYDKIDLLQRYYGNQDSEVEIIDTASERKKNGMIGNFSKKLIKDINDTLSRKGQVMILRGRRAYSLILQCDNCGEIVKCPHCDVPMNLHKCPGTENEYMECHYCGYREPFSGKCRKCGGELKAFGSGTQKIEEEAVRLFPNARIARLDSDSVKEKDEEENVIKDFAKGDIDIIVGTQIVTKGFDFAGLNLVAVMQADSLLGQQDFRADEKALQLLEQFRGRAGRRGEKGLFVIQTNQPGHPVYREIESGESGNSTITANMLNERRTFSYPPYSRLIVIILKDSNLPRLEKLSTALAREIETSASSGNPMGCIGPYAPVISRLSDQYIRHIRITIMKGPELTTLKKQLAATVAGFGKTRAYANHIVIDVDPL